MGTEPDAPKQGGDASGAEGPFAWVGRWLAGEDNVATPDVTKAQAAAIGQAAIAVLIVFGFDPSTDTRNIILGLATALAVALPASDAAIRYGRAANADRIVKARLDLKGDTSHTSETAAQGDRPSETASKQEVDLEPLLRALEANFAQLASQLEASAESVRQARRGSSRAPGERG